MEAYDKGNGASTKVSADAAVGSVRCEESVPRTTIDTILDTTSGTSNKHLTSPWGAVDVLKLDIEGYETLALMGARRLLVDHPPSLVVTEWIPFRVTSQVCTVCCPRLFALNLYG